MCVWEGYEFLGEQWLHMSCHGIKNAYDRSSLVQGKKTAQWMRWLDVSPRRPLSSLLYIHITVRASVAEKLVTWQM